MILRREVQKIRSGKWEELEEVYRNYKSPFRALGQAIGGRFGGSLPRKLYQLDCE